MALANFRDNIQDSRITDKALSNGSAMRIAPIGCLFRPEQKEDIARYVYQVSRATHTSDVTIAGAAMVAEAVSSAMVKDDFGEVMELSLIHIPCCFPTTPCHWYVPWYAIMSGSVRATVSWEERASRSM